MIRVNLLSSEVQATEWKFDPNYAIGGVAAFLIIVLLPFTLVQYSRRTSLGKEAISVENKLNEYKPIVAKVEELEQAKAQLVQRKSVIQILEAERLRYPYFMEDFIKLLPNNVWLTNLSTTLPPDGVTINVSLDVTALDHYAVADMISNLETSQIFSEVEIGPITASTSATGQSITFHITTLYRKGPSDPNAIKKS